LTLVLSGGEDLALPGTDSAEFNLFDLGSTEQVSTIILVFEDIGLLGETSTTNDVGVNI